MSSQKVDCVTFIWARFLPIAHRSRWRIWLKTWLTLEVILALFTKFWHNLRLSALDKQLKSSALGFCAMAFQRWP